MRFAEQWGWCSVEAVRDITLEPIQEDLIQEHWVERVRRLSMMRIMARRTKAATVLV
jgi:hypothetical protein